MRNLSFVDLQAQNNHFWSKFRADLKNLVKIVKLLPISLKIAFKMTCGKSWTILCLFFNSIHTIKILFFITRWNFNKIQEILFNSKQNFYLDIIYISGIFGKKINRNKPYWAACRSIQFSKNYKHPVKEGVPAFIYHWSAFMNMNCNRNPFRDRALHSLIDFFQKLK